MPNTPAVAGIAVEADGSTHGGRAGRPLPLWRYVLHTRSGRIAAATLGVLAVAALLAPVLAPFGPTDPLDIVRLKSQPPSAAHWFGTDSYSRDVLSRMLYGARISLRTGVLAATLAACLGLAWGAVAGFVGGTTDAVLMRVVDAFLAVPRILLILTIVALWDRMTPTGIVLVLGLTGWFGVSRLARAETLAIRSRDFVGAARALGTPPMRVLAAHVLPHALGPVLVAATIAIGQAVAMEAVLAFWGKGIPEPDPSWGNIIADARDTFATSWWLTLFPGLALVVTALSVNVLAERLREALNAGQLPE